MGVNGDLLEFHSGRIRRNEDGTLDMTTTVRAKERGRPGHRLIWGSVVLLAGLAGVAFYVSYAAQRDFVFAVKRLNIPAVAEALIPDAGMAICALLALAMAVQGRSARAARVAVVGFAALSGVMNYEAANSYSAHSITVYVMPAVAFAVCTDLVVSVVRRFYYGVEDGGSPWAPLGRAAGRVFRGLGVVVLYSLRLLLDWGPTRTGLRQMVLDAAPLPSAEIRQERQGRQEHEPEPGSKKAALIAAYKLDPRHGDRARASAAAKDLAPAAGLQWGTARTYINEHLASLNGAAR